MSSSADDGHNYRFGAPSKGWPTFDANGKLVRPHAAEVDVRKAAAHGVGFDGHCRECEGEGPPRVVDLMLALEDSLAEARARLR